MSQVVDRALAVAAARDYTGPQTRVLFRMALDADHDSGENCTTSLGRLHEAAGYADDGGRFRTTRRAVKRLEADGAIRCDVDAPGVGRAFTVCPVAPWSGVVPVRSAFGRKLSVWLRDNGTPDVQTSGANARLPRTLPRTSPRTSRRPATNGPTDQLPSLPTDLRDAGESERVEFDPRNLVPFKRIGPA